MGNWCIFLLPGCEISSKRDSSVRSYQQASLKYNCICVYSTPLFLTQRRRENAAAGVLSAALCQLQFPRMFS